MSITNDEDRSRIEQRADEARADLARTLASLDARRREVAEAPKMLLHRYAVPAAIVGGGILLGLIGSAVWGVFAARRRLQHMWRERGYAVQRAWRHPERVAEFKDRPLPVELVRRVLIASATLVTSQLVRRGVHRLMPAPTVHLDKDHAAAGGETIVRVTT